MRFILKRLGYGNGNSTGDAVPPPPSNEQPASNAAAAFTSTALIQSRPATAPATAAALSTLPAPSSLPGLSLLQSLKRSLSTPPAALSLSRSSTVSPTTGCATAIVTAGAKSPTANLASELDRANSPRQDRAQTPSLWRSDRRNIAEGRLGKHATKPSKMSTPPMSCCSKEVAEDPFARVCPSPPSKPNSAATCATSSLSHSPTVSISSPPSVSDYFPSPPHLSRSVSTTAHTSFSYSASSGSGGSRLPISPASFTSSRNDPNLSLSTSATSQSSFLSSFSQDAIVTSSEATSNHYYQQPLLLEEEQVRRSSSSKRDGSPYPRQRSALCLKRTVTAPILPVVKDIEHLPDLALPPLPQLTTHAHGEGMFAASHASPSPVARKGVHSRFIEHLDVTFSTGSTVDLELYPMPTVSTSFSDPMAKTTSVPPPLTIQKSKYGSLPLLRTRSRDLLAGRSSKKASVTSVFSGSPRMSSDSFVNLPSTSSTSSDYPFFGADGTKVKEGRPLLYRKGASAPLVAGSRSKSSTFLPICASDEEEICSSIAISDDQRSSVPFVSSLVPRKATI